MASTSFGLSSEYKVGLQKQIFELVYYTRGGFTFEDVYYAMPVYLRQFHYNELVETLKREAKAVSSTPSSPKNTKITPPTWAQK